MRKSQSKYRLLLLVIFHCSFSIVNFSQESISLNGEWEFKKKGEPRYRRATVPGVVHLDLMRNRMIEDPYWGNNELRYQWIENETWVYRKVFSLNKNQLENAKNFGVIEFEGLDTYAKVYVNDSLMFEANNMFRRWEHYIGYYLKEGENEILVEFLPIREGAKEYSKRKYDLPAGCETVKEKRSPWVRKAAYHFGWDWGPRFVTCGIWKDVRLNLSRYSIDYVHFQTLSISDSTALMRFNATTLGTTSGKLKLFVDSKEYEMDFHGSTGYATLNFEIENPELWWCNGQGNPNLYDAELVLVSDKGEVLHSKKVRFGIRTIELINEKDSIGTSFYFKLNDKPVFVKGANYIPQDLFLPSVRDENYHQLLSQVDDANMNMLRVWGGGIYENDIFYDLCDEKGIMVWQDLMFAGSMYPSSKEFLENVQIEISENVSRLRNHPCIAIWCGNNEMEVAWQNWGWQKQFGWSEKDSIEIWNSYLELFHKAAPEIIYRWDSTTNYTPSSPLSNWGTPENFNHSSMHYWGVWHGKEPIENYRNNVGRFMVEYGFQSYPEMSTISKFCYPKDQKLNSKIMENRQKSYIGNEEISKQIKKYAGKPKDFQEFVELSQEVQAKAMQIAITAHMNAQPHCMGTMFWQLNDCWPGPSWSVIDYYGNEKKAYQVVKTLFR